MKIFISQPMNGKTEQEIIAERAKLQSYINYRYGNNVEIIDSYLDDYNPTTGCIPMKYLAKSIQLLADADVAVFAKGWNVARGCRIEYVCASSYGIKIDCGW